MKPTHETTVGDTYLFDCPWCDEHHITLPEGLSIELGIWFRCTLCGKPSEIIEINGDMLVWKAVGTKRRK